MRFPIAFVIVLLPSALFGQTAPAPGVQRTIHLANPPSVTGFQELATVLRTVDQIRTLTVDPPSASLSITGTPAEISVAEWTIHALDLPVAPDDATKQIRDGAVHEFRMPGDKDDVVRMFYFTSTTTPQATQELLTVLRTVGRIRYTFNYTPLHALAVRGSSDEIAFSAWLIQELDQAPAVQTEGIHQFRSSDATFPIVRAFYPAHPLSEPRVNVAEPDKLMRQSTPLPVADIHTSK